MTRQSPPSPIPTADTQVEPWITTGFAGFRQGDFGNAGANLYVSRAGVLQRIHHFDLNQDGYTDLVFCNSQNHWERAPAYVYRDCLGAVQRRELPAEGARGGVVADLNGDGYADLVVGNYYNGINLALNATIYFGSPDGWSEQFSQPLPAPRCSSVAVGDFDGDGRLDLALLCVDHVRFFYQREIGFEPKRSIDLALAGEELAAADLDGDGYADLLVRHADGTIQIYWGGPDGINMARFTQVPVPLDAPAGQDTILNAAEYVKDAVPLVRALTLAGQPHIFVARHQSVTLLPVTPTRSFGLPTVLACPRAMSIATGDLRGQGVTDLVIACRQSSPDGREQSWIYWGDQGQYRADNRRALATFRACDVAVADLDGDGVDEIVICQNHDGDSFTTAALVYRASDLTAPITLVAHDARRVLIGRSSDHPTPDVVLINHFARSKIGQLNNVIYFGGPDGFQPDRAQWLPGWGAVEALRVDLNDDGLPDLVFANAAENAVSRDPGSYIYLNHTTGFAPQPDTILPTARAHGVACADLNRDGYLDLIFCGFNNPELLIFYGSATGFDRANPTRLRMEHEGVVYSEPRWIYLADLNNDGHLDLVVPQCASDRSLILWGGPDGFSMDRCQFLPIIHAICARAVDLTGNGYLDLIVGSLAPSTQGPHDSFVYIYWNSPAGLSSARCTILPANHVNSISVADYNNDGRLDLFVGSYADGRVRDLDSYIYWNRPDRFFSALDRTRLFTHSASGSVAADFNGDGYVDLAVANHKVWGDHVGYSEIWWNGPDGFDARRTTRLPTSGPHGMTAVEPGNLLDRGAEETYISRAYPVPVGVMPSQISWQAALQPQTWVKAQLRTAADQAGLATAPWLGPSGADSWFDNQQAVPVGLCSGRWLQYRLALGATNSGCTPRVTEVQLAFMPSLPGKDGNVSC